MSANLVIERHRLVFDLMKHLTTLASGSSLLVITVDDRLVVSSDGGALVAASLLCFLISLLASLIVMSTISIFLGQTVFHEPSKIPRPAVVAIATSIVASAVGYFSGVCILVVYAAANLL